MSSLSAEFIHNLIKFALLPRLARASRGHTLTTPPPPFPHPTPSPIQDTAHLYSRVRCHHRLCSASAAPDAWLTSHRFSRTRQGTMSQSSASHVVSGCAGGICRIIGVAASTGSAATAVACENSASASARSRTRRGSGSDTDTERASNCFA